MTLRFGLFLIELSRLGIFIETRSWEFWCAKQYTPRWDFWRDGGARHAQLGPIYLNYGPSRALAAIG